MPARALMLKALIPGGFPFIMEPWLSVKGPEGRLRQKTLMLRETGEKKLPLVNRPPGLCSFGWLSRFLFLAFFFLTGKLSAEAFRFCRMKLPPVEVPRGRFPSLPLILIPESKLPLRQFRYQQHRLPLSLQSRPRRLKCLWPQSRLLRNSPLLIKTFSFRNMPPSHELAKVPLRRKGTGFSIFPRSTEAVPFSGLGLTGSSPLPIHP